MIRFKEFLILLLAIGIHKCYSIRNSYDDCPKRCYCYQTVVNCGQKNFNTIPSIPIYTELLYLNDNPLETLTVQQREFLINSPNNLTFIDFTRTNLRNIETNSLQTIFNDAYVIEQSLIKLKFDENELQTFPLLSHATKLRSISLTSNKLSYESIIGLDIFTNYYPQLESLDLSFNSIRRIPTHFLSSNSASTASDYVNNLTHLILNNNQIEHIENDAFELFKNLKILRLSRNNIQVISKSWIGYQNLLKELDLNYNQINKIDILAFEGLKKLQVLKMRRNKLDVLSDGSFWGLSKLQKLHLDHNNITEIKEGWTYGLSSLKELTIKHNSITKIGNNSWNSAHNLVEINLSFNQLERIEKKMFERLTLLQTLKLSNNEISYVDEYSFRSLKNLQSLDLSFNKLSWTIESSNGFFLGLEQLKELRLDNNLIRLIFTHTFNGLKSLQMLNLTSNPITSIQNKSFDWFEQIQQLYLENIDLLCDCTMRWLSQWLRRFKAYSTFATKIQCKHPEELALRTRHSFLDVDPEEFKCQDFLKPYLLEDFKNITKPISAIKNKDISFYCKIATSSDDRTIFKWFKDNQIIDHDRAQMNILSQAYSDNVTHYTSVLRLINIQDEDQGRYHCMATNKYGSVYSHKFPVNVYVQPYFTKIPQNVTVRVGHTAKLECSAKGQPMPVISWQKDGGDNFPAAMERRMRVMHDDDVFFIVEVKKIDMGSYSCHASNDAGAIVSTVFLNVIESPSFVRKMVDKKATIGSTVSLECMAAGIPMPQIIWYKDGQELRQTERHFFTAGGQLLIIVKLKPTDHGQYSCKIFNDFGQKEDSSYLNIIMNANHSLERMEQQNLFASFYASIRTHGLYVIIIVSCVMFTSLAWIIGICYIRKSDLKTQRKHQHDHEQNEPKYLKETTINFDHTKLKNSLLKHHQFHSFHQLNENDFYQDQHSESSSALDTGIEGSCHSYEDDNELPNNFHNYQMSRKYHSLPRKQIRLYNNQINTTLIQKPFQQISPQSPPPPQSQPHIFSSLPRRPPPNPKNYHQQQSCPMDVSTEILINKVSRKHNNNVKASVLSSKEKKLSEKKRQHQKWLEQRTNYPIMIINDNNSGNIVAHNEDNDDNFESQMQMMNNMINNDNNGDGSLHRNYLNNHYQHHPTMMRTFSINKINSTTTTTMTSKQKN